MTAATKDGKEVFNAQKIYMPQSPAYGRGDKMAYGPMRKGGMLRDTSLQPGTPKKETIEIPFPVKEVEKEGKKVKEPAVKEMDVTIRLWYLPAGGEVKTAVTGKEKYLLYEAARTVSIK